MSEEIIVDEEIPPDEIGVDQQQAELSFTESLKHSLSGIAKWVLFAAWLIGLWQIPDRLLYFYSSIFFYFVLDKGIRKLVDTITILAVDLDTGDLGGWRLSRQNFNDYQLLDPAGRITGLKWTFRGQFDEVAIVDGFDTVGKVMIVNPMCCALHFVTKYREKCAYLMKVSIKRLSEIIRLRSRREDDTLHNSYEIYKKHPVLKLIGDEEEEKEKEAQEDLQEKQERVDEVEEKEGQTIEIEDGKVMIEQGVENDD